MYHLKRKRTTVASLLCWWLGGHWQNLAKSLFNLYHGKLPLLLLFFIRFRRENERRTQCFSSRVQLIHQGLQCLCHQHLVWAYPTSAPIVASTLSPTVAKWVFKMVNNGNDQGTHYLLSQLVVWCHWVLPLRPTQGWRRPKGKLSVALRKKENQNLDHPMPQ